jgi:protein-S-isoprenylcysteine O-methyltransferase Ste14
MDTTGARVRVLPPLVFLLPLGSAILLDRLVSLGLPWPGLWRWPGGVLVVAGLGVMVWAFATMRAAGTTVVPWEEVKALVTTGPFRLSRNPVYLGDLLLYLGITLIVASWWPVVFLPFVLLLMHRRVIRPEEDYLGGRFGGDYAAYRARVRRWL